jgi:tRNA(Ile)-lysidine synthase
MAEDKVTSALLEKISRRWPLDRWSGLTVVVGCSGGADSTALVLALKELKPKETSLVVAHFNHGLRGAESDGDEAFVEDLARQSNLEFHTGRRSDRSLKSDESALREMRYSFLEELALRIGARYVVLGHTADDSVETTLHNLIRGTGLQGLAGIPPHRDLGCELVLVRPMIDVWRTEVEAFMNACGQSYRTDSSNASNVFTRNRIRRHLMSFLVNEFGESTRTAILRAGRHAAEASDYLHEQAINWLDKAIDTFQKDTIVLHGYEALCDVPWPVVQRGLVECWNRQVWPLQSMTAAHWDRLREIWEMSAGESNSIDLPGKIRMESSGGNWWFTRES